jgi:hypothetical protein
MDSLSLGNRWVRDHPHDNGGHHDILAGSREDGHLPLALLDLIIYTMCSRPLTLSVEVLRARASIVAVFIGLISFVGPGSFQVLLVILILFFGGAWN